jgi:hypothetical protein
VLKSFRDRPVDFAVYDRSGGLDGYLSALGPLRMPTRGSAAGLDVAASPLVAAPLATASQPSANPHEASGEGSDPSPASTSHRASTAAE